MNERKIPPKTAHTRVVAVRSFFKFHDIPIDEKTREIVKRVKPKGGRRTDFEYLDKENIREILAHGDVRLRAFVLVLASSGIRLGEALALTWADITIPDRTKSPDKTASLFIANSKTGNARQTFISREAENALNEWKKVIPQYREKAKKLANNLKKTSNYHDDLIFPISRTVVYELWDNALTDAGHMNKDVRTKRTRMNIHRLRTFFSSTVAHASNKDSSEALLGHIDRWGGAYIDMARVERDYKTAESDLTIYNIGVSSTEIDDLKERLNTLENLLKITTAAMIDNRNDPTFFSEVSDAARARGSSKTK